LLWHTRRLLWDGFDELRIVGEELVVITRHCLVMHGAR
jgi:hypothetical protein